MGQDGIDTRALELATQALARIDAHEKTCTERWRESFEAQRHTNAAIADLHKSTSASMATMQSTTAGAISALSTEISQKFRELYNFNWRIALGLIVCLGAAASGMVIFIYMHGIR